MEKKLYRDEYHKKIGGVCAGLADYFETDVTLIRILFVVAAFTSVGLIAYIILWAVLPKRGIFFNGYNNPAVDYTVPPQQPGDQFNAGNTFGGNPYNNSQWSGTPWTGNPAQDLPPKQKSNAGLVIGLVLIILGSVILIDEYDLIPDFNFGRLWPVILVIVGCSLIVSGQKKQPWHADEWKAADVKTETEPVAAKDEDTTKAE